MVPPKKDTGKGKSVGANDNTSTPLPSSSQPAVALALPAATSTTRAVRSQMAQSALLLELFRFRIGLYIVDTEVLLAYLHSAGGDVDEAEILFFEAHDAAVARWPVQNPGPQPPLPQALNGMQYIYFDIAEQERRAVVDMLPAAFNTHRDANNQVHFRISEAVLLLEHFGWALGRAARASDEDLLSMHRRYDTVAANSNHKQAFAFSLAVLLGITGRADWWSVSEHLRKSGNSLAAALRAWFLTGIKIKVHRQDKPGCRTHGKWRRSDRWGRPLLTPNYAGKSLYSPRAGANWKEEVDATPRYYSSDDEDRTSESSSSSSGASTVGDSEASQDSDTDSSNKKPRTPLPKLLPQALGGARAEPGIIINFDEAGPEVYCPLESKMLIEYVTPRSGKYRSNFFVNEKFHWPTLDGPANPKGLPRFDWNSQGDVSLLRSWRRENYRRIMGHKLRSEGEQWPPVQEDFLYNLYKEEHEKRKASGDDKLPMKISEKLRNEWADKMNKEFGTHRRGQAILQRANRVEATIKDFKLKRDMGYFKGLEKSAQRFPEKEKKRRDQLRNLVRDGTTLVGNGIANIANSGAPIGTQDIRSFDAAVDGTNQDGYLTDRAIAAGLATLRLQHTAIVDIQVANLYFSDPTVQLPAIDITAENTAVIMHFGQGTLSHWTVGIYNSRTRQYQLFDSLPDPDGERQPIMVARMQAIVNHYFPSHGALTQGLLASYPQDNGYDCGVYVIENVRAIDQARPTPRINSTEARIRLVREVIRLIREGQVVPGPVSSNAPPAADPSGS